MACEKSSTGTHFKYKCSKGWGLIDGSTCYAQIQGAYHLRLMEGQHERPHITYLVDGGGERVIPPGPGNYQRYITNVGVNATWLIAKDDLGQYYIVEFTDSFPDTKPPISADKYRRLKLSTEFPELRPTLE